MFFLGAARMAQVDILLCILVREVDVVGFFVKVSRACHACMSILYVKTTRLTYIPVGKALDRV
jgi:hypothetical protein